MQSDNSMSRKLLSKYLMDVIIRVGLIAFVVVMCVQVLAPFAGLVLWALIVAVALYPLHQRLAKYLFTIYLLVAGLADNVLKPLLLGRGVDAPMPVILLGALGGMVSAGIIGLFIGAVLLAVGYQVFMEWVDEPEEGTTEGAGQSEAVAQESAAGE